MGRLPADPLVSAARDQRIPAVVYSAEGTAAELRALDIDLIVIATFPHVLSPALIASAHNGGVNLHQSLLPRLRGSDPLFWTYYDDEREAGTTVHWLDAGVDTGDIVAQESMPVARGQSIVDVYFTLAERGAKQLSSALAAIAAGTAPRRAQDPALATSRPSPRSTSWRVPFDQWSAERTWHFVSGTAQLFGSLYRDPTGAALPMGRARTYSMERHGRRPGTHEVTANGIRLYCSDGIVEVTPP